jgi:hypothetical protein
LTRARALLLGMLACAALAVALGAHDLDVPGLYYDEVIQVEPALWFLRADPTPPEVPGARSLPLFGRRYPLMTQPYMGALKSQLLIPFFAVAEPDVSTLRLATFAVAVAGLVCAMAAAARAFDPATALILGLLLATDPAFLFIGRHDWGSFSLGLLLRSATALLLLSAWRSGSTARFFAGGLCAGLAVYNKIDAGMAVAAAAAAWLVATPQAWRALREHRTGVAYGIAGVALGAVALVVRSGPALALTASALGRSLGNAASGEWAEKWSALLATLDGSYFARLMQVGGSFERMAAVADAPSTLFPLLFAASWLGLALWLLQERRHERRHPAHAFVLLAALLTIAGMLLTPRAVRIHHHLNAWPLPQLVVAVALRELWRRAQPPAVVARGCVVAALALVLAGALHATRATFAEVRATGGKGLWSGALTPLAPSLEGARVVCLDWGFAGQLRFTDPRLDVEEPIWTLRRPRQPVAMEGNARQVYLLHEPPYAVFPFGERFLAALTALPPGSASIERHAGRSGDTDFLAVRFARPHRLVYRDRRFEVELR